MTVGKHLENKGVKIAKGDEFPGVAKGDIIIDSLESLKSFQGTLVELAEVRAGATAWVDQKKSQSK